MAIVRTGYANFASFPPTGAIDIIYVDLSNGDEYTWVTSAYVAYTPVKAYVSLGYKNAAWFAANPGLLLAPGQPVLLEQTGLYKVGTGVTELQNLAFLGNMTTIQDGLTSGGEISIVGDDITVAPAGWLISPNVYGTLVNTDFLNIALSSPGNQRYIGFYGNTSNSIVKVEGSEAPLASYPTQPANTVIVGFVLVGDAVIDTQPDLTGFEEKINKVNTVVGNETDADKYPNIPAIIAYLQAVYNLQQVTDNGSNTTNTVSVISSGANQEKVKVFGSDLQNKVVLGTDSFNGGQAKFYDSSESETVTIRGESGRIEAFEYNLPTETASRIAVLDSGKTLRSGSISESDIATISYVDGLVDLTFKPAGNWDASGNTFPTTGTGFGGSVQAGDVYKVSVAGTPSGFETLDVGDSFYAIIDVPGQTASNWAKFETNTQQAAETFRGTLAVSTQAEIEDNASTNDIDAVTPKKFWLGWTKIKTLASQVITQIWEFLGIDFTPQAAPAYKEGRVWYDSSDKAISVYDDVSGTSIQVGQETVVRARNNTGSTVSNGQAVYISGALGQNPTIALAKGDVESTSLMIGLATHDILNNTVGKVTVIGIVRDLNTSAFSDGDALFLSPTTAGALTNIAPSSPNFSVPIGFVAHSHVTQGKIFVRTEMPLATNTSLGTSNRVAPSQGAVKSAIDALSSVYQTIITSTSWGAFINGLTPKSTPVDADQVVLMDSADSNKAKKLSWANLMKDARRINKDIRKTQDAAAVTGTTAETIMDYVLVPGGRFTVDDIIYVENRIKRSSVLLASTVRIRVNTSNSLTGATLVATGTLNNTILVQVISRNMVIKSSTNTEVFGAATSFGNDAQSSTVAVSSLNIDWSVDQYILVTTANGSVGESTVSSYVAVEKR